MTLWDKVSLCCLYVLPITANEVTRSIETNTALLGHYCKACSKCGNDLTYGQSLKFLPPTAKFGQEQDDINVD